MKKKPFPYIAIEGVGKTKEEVLDSLIAIEPILVKLGYKKPNERWNNYFCSLEFSGTWEYSAIHCEKKLEYHNHLSGASNIRFKSTEIDKLIKYMINNKYIK